MMTDRDRAGRTPVHYAALEGDAARALQFIDAGYDVNEPDGNGFTPLHFAAQRHALEVTRVLLEHGADIDTVNRFGNSPLLVAMSSSKGRTEEIILLRDMGADRNLKNKAGVSAVDLARTITNFDFTDLFPETSL
jgi:ankyrin repeat protein